MCPLASANTDSVCARLASESAVSRTAQGSTGNAGCWITCEYRGAAAPDGSASAGIPAFGHLRPCHLVWRRRDEILSPSNPAKHAAIANRPEHPVDHRAV